MNTEHSLSNKELQRKLLPPLVSCKGLFLELVFVVCVYVLFDCLD